MGALNLSMFHRTGFGGLLVCWWVDRCLSFGGDRGSVAVVLTLTIKISLDDWTNITPVLYQFHWLQVKYGIQFKILLITFKAIHGVAPDYIRKLITRKTSTRYSLRSSQKIMLEVPSGKILATLERRAVMQPQSSGTIYRVVYPVLTLFQVLRAILKTHLFKQAFNLL